MRASGTHSPPLSSPGACFSVGSHTLIPDTKLWIFSSAARVYVSAHGKFRAGGAFARTAFRRNPPAILDIHTAPLYRARLFLHRILSSSIHPPLSISLSLSLSLVYFFFFFFNSLSSVSSTIPRARHNKDRTVARGGRENGRMGFFA